MKFTSQCADFGMQIDSDTSKFIGADDLFWSHSSIYTRVSLSWSISDFRDGEMKMPPCVDNDIHGILRESRVLIGVSAAADDPQKEKSKPFASFVSNPSML